MTHTKLYVALQSLSKEECKSLQRYLIMETSDTSNGYHLFHYLNECHKSSNSPKSKDEVRHQLFPTMTEKKFLNLCSKVYLVVEDWLVWYDIKKDKMLCSVHLVKAYNRRGVFELADKAFMRARKKLSQQEKIDLRKSEHLHNLYKYHYFSENPVKVREGKDIFEKLVQYWTQNYKEKSHLYIAEMQNWGGGMNFDYSIAKTMLINSIDGLPESETSMVTQIIQKLTSNGDQETLDELYNLLIEGKIQEGSDLEVFITLYAIAHSIKMWSSGKLKNKEYISRMYDYALSSKILMNLGKLTSSRFLNIISVIVLTSKPSLTYEFLEKWSHIIDPKDRNPTVAIAKCYVKREEGKYGDIILILRNVQYTNLNLTMLSLVFLIKAFYKEKEYDVAQNTINNFKRRLRKTKTGTEKTYYYPRLNFLLVMEQLIKSKHKKISIDLDQYKHLHHRIWLSKQL
ncbi:MAG: hypothetical protein ACJA1A_002504 [Saprospiraceae bacterium]|jgi:hypothetical protein